MEITAHRKRPPPVSPGDSSAGKKTRRYLREITALPPELIEKIFANLDSGDLVACKRVSTGWDTIIETSPVLPCAVYRRYQPLPPRTPKKMGSGSNRRRYPPLGEVSSVCCSPHGVLAIAGEKTVTVWGKMAGQWQKKADLAHDIPVHKITFSVDGQCILAQHLYGESVNIWTLQCKE